MAILFQATSLTLCCAQVTRTSLHEFRSDHVSTFTEYSHQFSALQSETFSDQQKFSLFDNFHLFPSPGGRLPHLDRPMNRPFRSTLPVLRRFRRATGKLARKGNPSLHPKHGPRSFNKGYGAPAMGRHTRRGGYIVDYDRKVPEYVVPDLEGCELKPYVSFRTPKIKVPPPPMS